MQNQNVSFHPVVVFWIGVLTGALIVGLVFLYGIYFKASRDIQDQLIRGGTLEYTMNDPGI